MKKSTLFLERLEGEIILIGKGRNLIELQVSKARNGKARLTFTGGAHIPIDRKERRIQEHE